MSIGQQDKKNLMFYGAIALVALIAAGAIFTQMRGKTRQVSAVTYNLDSKTLLAKPFLTDEEITQFVARAAKDILTFEYETYKEDLQHARGYFTEQGWLNIQVAFQESGMLNHVVEQEMDVNSIVTADPVITQQGAEGGIYNWVVEAPFLMVYNVGGDTHEERTRMTMRIYRSDDAKNPEHVGITQIILTPQ